MSKFACVAPGCGYERRLGYATCGLHDGYVKAAVIESTDAPCATLPEPLTATSSGESGTTFTFSS